MSKYPRTDAARLKDVCPHMAMAAECTRMEYELNEAKARIKRLEEAGDVLMNCIPTELFCNQKLQRIENQWRKAKEAKL